MLFMGEEFASKSPFQFFCDFGEELREAVTQGRRREFAGFARFSDASMEAAIPDPNAPQTFLTSKIDWNALEEEKHGGWLDYYRKLLKLRRDVLIPRLPGMKGRSAQFEVFASDGLRVQWQLGDGSTLRLLANFSRESLHAAPLPGRTVFASSSGSASSDTVKNMLDPCSVVWALEPLPSASEARTPGRANEQ
jgi:1,4-alpha-glucan branching enzyme/maltooligosyltrehalose trehalohydrolase